MLAEVARIEHKNVCLTHTHTHTTHTHSTTSTHKHTHGCLPGWRFPGWVPSEALNQGYPTHYIHRQTDRPTDRPTDRQTDRHTDTHTHTTLVRTHTHTHARTHARTHTHYISSQPGYHSVSFFPNYVLHHKPHHKRLSFALLLATHFPEFHVIPHDIPDFLQYA